MLFGVGHPNPAQCTMVLLFLGVLAHDLDPAWLQTTQNKAHVLGFAVVPPEQDPAIESMAQFLRACILAARLESPILVDC